MSNLEVERMIDPAPLRRMYPTRQVGVDGAGVDTDPDELYADFLARTGRQGGPADAQAFAVAQRNAARTLEGRPAVTAGGVRPGMVTAPPGFGPASPAFVVGSLEQEAPKPRRRGLLWRRRDG